MENHLVQLHTKIFFVCLITFLYQQLKKTYTYRGVAIGGETGGMNLPHFDFRIKQGPTVSVSNIRDIAFYGCSEIIQTRNVTIFSVYATFFGQFTMNFHFF